MLSFSLIIATLGRTTELEYLFSSLASQAYPRFECIVVDQNPDRRVKDVVDRWKCQLNLRVVDSAPGLSRARNVGLELATCDVLAFPDDDCWYTPSLLKSVSTWFETHPNAEIFTVGAFDLDGSPSGNRWIRDRSEIRPHNAFRTTFSSTIFVRRTTLTRDQGFDELLGVGAGTRFGSGEETDYVLNLLKRGARGFLDRSLHVGHPKRDMLSGHIDVSRARSYGSGMGYVLRKQTKVFLAFGFIAYDLVRSLIVLVKGELAASRLCLSHARGIAAGYFSSSPKRPETKPPSYPHRHATWLSLG
jgi:glycosyltransferase involved in cell wall biosynthesis